METSRPPRRHRNVAYQILQLRRIEPDAEVYKLDLLGTNESLEKDKSGGGEASRRVEVRSQRLGLMATEMTEAVRGH